MEASACCLITYWMVYKSNPFSAQLFAACISIKTLMYGLAVMLVSSLTTTDEAFPSAA
jgi:hypothetical protein